MVKRCLFACLAFFFLTFQITPAPADGASAQRDVGATLPQQDGKGNAAVALASPVVDANDWLLVPHNRAGVIKKDWSISEVENYFGRGSLVNGTINIYGQKNAVYPVTTIYPGTDREISIVWTDDSRSSIAWLEVYLTASRVASKWKLADGYYVGMTLADMEKTAGKPMPFSGFYNGAAGFVPFSEFGGVYAKTAGIQLRIGFADESVGRKFMGDGIRWSSSPEVSPYKDKLVLACVGIGMNREPQLIRD